MLLPETRRYYLLIIARMNKAALKQLCSLLADIIITALTAVDIHSNFFKATRKKGYLLSSFCAGPYGEMIRRCVRLCFKQLGTLFFKLFSWTRSEPSARIKIPSGRGWTTVADTYLLFYMITCFREGPVAWISKNVYLRSSKIHINWC